MKFFTNVILGISIVCIPLLANETNKIQSIKNTISTTQKNSVTKIFSQNIEITNKPQNYKNWGEWIIAENKLDKNKWRAVKIKGSDMWGISPIIDGKNDCGVVLWICQHSKKMVFNAEKFKQDGLCGKIRESYKEQDNNYKKISVPFVF